MSKANKIELTTQRQAAALATAKQREQQTARQLKKSFFRFRLFGRVVETWSGKAQSDYATATQQRQTIAAQYARILNEINNY